MGTVLTVVLVVAACWFSLALVLGIVLGTFLRRARTLAVAHDTLRVTRTSVRSEQAEISLV